jgi:outer membrane protein TolC
VPVSIPTNQRYMADWCRLLNLASERRPDVIELKLILEADRQRQLVAENNALPRLDAVGQYRWNGIDGTMPSGEQLASGAGQYTDWTLGINFSVPLGLRAGRAGVRQTTLLIARDQANLDQSIHAATHEIAANLRDIDNAYEQYRAYVEARAAALENLKVQIEQFRAERAIYLNVLQALNDWGNSVSAEAQALLSYNIALATLERRTGTILETHGLIFMEERFRAAGPLFGTQCYAESLPPAGAPTRYPPSPQPSEQSFDLSNPDPR